MALRSGDSAYPARAFLWLGALLWLLLCGCGCSEPDAVRAGPLLLAAQQSSGAAPAPGGAFRLPSLPDLADRVLVVYHEAFPESRDVAEHYRKLRGIPKENLCAIDPPGDFALDIAQFEQTVKTPIRKCLERVDSRKILYVVLSFRTPFRVRQDDRKFNAAVDSIIADIWDESQQNPFPERFSPPHAYFAAHQSQGNFYFDYLPLKQFRERAGAPRIYAVFRLDGPTEELARGLATNAVETERAGGLKGRGCFDRNSGPLGDRKDASYAAGEWAIERAAQMANAAGMETTLDENKEEFGTEPAPARCEAAAFYAGWYSLNNYNDAFTWAPGAIGFHLDSLSALHPRSGKNWAANAVQKGIAATSGAIDEPYLAQMPQADGVFHDLLQGANLGDALLRNTPSMKWRIIHFGDPLYRPFSKGAGPVAQGLMPGPAIGLAQPVIPGGVRLEAYVSSGGAITEERTVRLFTEPGDLVLGPETIRIPASERSATVVLSTVGVSVETDVQLRVTSGGQTVLNHLKLMPVIQDFRISPNPARSGAPLSLRLALAPLQGAGELEVRFRSSCPETVVVSESLRVPVGLRSASAEGRVAQVSETVSCEVAATALGGTRRTTVRVEP